MYETISPIALTAEEQLGYRNRLARLSTDLRDTATALKKHYLLWTRARNMPAIKQILGAELAAENERIYRQILELSQVVRNLAHRKTMVIGYSLDGGKTYDLGIIETKKYRAIMAEKGYFGAFWFAIGGFVLGLSAIGAAGVLAYKGLEYAIAKIKTDADTVQAQSLAQAMNAIAAIGKNNPALAGKMTDAFKRAADDAAKKSDDSWWSDFIGGLKGAAIGGFGGLALGLFLALSMSRKRGR